MSIIIFCFYPLIFADKSMIDNTFPKKIRWKEPREPSPWLTHANRPLSYRSLLSKSPTIANTKPMTGMINPITSPEPHSPREEAYKHKKPNKINDIPNNIFLIPFVMKSPLFHRNIYCFTLNETSKRQRPVPCPTPVPFQFFVNNFDVFFLY